MEKGWGPLVMSYCEYRLGFVAFYEDWLEHFGLNLIKGSVF